MTLRAKPSSIAVLLVFVSCITAAFGCKSTNTQPADPYTCRIPAPATYSYSPTILGQQPSQSNYCPQGAATTYPNGVPATNTIPTTTAPAAIPVSPNPATSPMSSAQPASIYGSLSNGATIYPTTATSSPTTNSWVPTQTIPSTYSSETATRNVDALAAAVPITSGSVSMASFDTWSTSSSQVVTQVSE